MKAILKILSYAKQWTPQLVVATTALFFVTGLNLAAPTLIRELFHIIEGGGDNQFQQIVVVSVLILAAYLLRLLFQFLNSYYAHVAAWYTVANLRGRLYQHMQTLSLRYYSDKQTGQLMSRVIEDTANLEVLIAHALPDLITSCLVLVGVLVIVFLINPLLALVTCIPVPFIFLTTIMLKKIRRRFTERQKISAELNGLLQDNLSGMKEIQVFNRQQHEYDHVSSKAHAHAKKTLEGLVWVARLHPTMNFLTGVGNFLVVLVGGLMAISASFGLGLTVTVADISVFLLYLGQLYAPVATLSRVLEDIQTAVVSGSRITEVLDTQPEIADSENAQPLKDVEGKIEFKDVYFDYSKESAVLKGVSFTAEAGQMIALVGATGAGKTTITSLITRFYDVSGGEVLVDGTNIKDCTLQSLRQNISMVLQDVFLFNGTIYDNISYSRQGEVSEQEIIDAAKAADIHEFIESLPDKYATMIGERGMRLSGGQKQRLAIARAILRKSPILILDEATSAVDNETETHIQTAINNLLGKSTVIVIAHRLSTVEKANQILVLDEGKIIERGTHAQLLELGGAYTKLYNKN